MNTYDDVIAIVGYSYKLPGNVSNEENLWEVLNSNNHVYSDVCKSGRWSDEFHDSSNMPSPGKAYVANAGLLENIKQFDSNFFDIPAIEANYLDPQQRILLETSWHALEHANINPHKLRGSNTGVFVGVTTDDYARLHSQSGLSINSYTGIGSAKSIAAGRLAYFYDFKGPVIQLDTTCSSSLVCIHLALQELRKKSCDLALVAGVNAILSPETTIGFCEMKALSKSGKLSAFDDTADGYIRGEGGGVFVLKRLKDAEKDGNNIHAIILGSAINHDGKTNGLTAPNPNSQIAVIKEAIKNAKLEIDDIDYVETHGTGTKLGDLMEANALGAIFSKKNNNLEIGSVKANIGHLEAAAGIASLAKTMLLIKKREIPGQVNLNQKSTRINWGNLNLNIDSRSRKLSQNKQLKIGVSGFGMSGTNAHIIIGEYLKKDEKSLLPHSLYTFPLFLSSAKNDESLSRNITNLKAMISKSKKKFEEIDQLSISTQKNRNHFKQYRSAFFIDHSDSLIDLNYQKKHDSNDREEIVFVFSGQGTHYATMGAELYNKSSIFKIYLDRCAQTFNKITGKNLIGIINNKEDCLLNQTENVQPAIVAIEIALSKFWENLGIVPTAVVGHSIGEYAAAVTAGCLTIEEAMELVILRGESIAKSNEKGIMFSVSGEIQKIESLIEKLPNEITVAAYNSPINITLSLSIAEKEKCLNIIKELGVKYFELTVSYPFHSKLLLEASNIFYNKTKNIVRNREKIITWVQTGDDAPNLHEYFVNQITSPIYFEKAIRELVERGYSKFLEIGANPVLGSNILSIKPEAEIAYSLKKDGILKEDITKNLAKLYLMGLDVNWNEVSYGPINKELPLYSFLKSEYWLPLNLENMEVGNLSNKGFNIKTVSHTNDKVIFLVNLNKIEQPHILEHNIFDIMIFAGASWIALALQAGQKILGNRPICINNLKFLKPLFIDKSAYKTNVKLVFEKKELNNFEFKFYSEDETILFCEGVVGRHDFKNIKIKKLENWKYEDFENYKDFYYKFDRQGYTLGRSFQWIYSGLDKDREALRKLKQPILISDLNSYSIYPGLLDSCFHALYSLISKDLKTINGDEIVIPSEVTSLVYLGNTFGEEEYDVYATTVNDEGKELPKLCGGFNLVSSSAGTIIDVESIKFDRVSKKLLLSNTEEVNIFVGKKNYINYTESKIVEDDNLVAIEENLLPNHINFSDFLDSPDGSKIIKLIINEYPIKENSVDVIVEDCIYIKNYIFNTIIPVVNNGEKVKIYAFIKNIMLDSNINVNNSGIFGFLKSLASEIENLSIVFVDSRFNKPNTLLDKIVFLNNIDAGDYLFEDDTLKRMEIVPLLKENCNTHNDNDLSQGVTIVVGAGGLLNPTLDWLLESGSKDIVIFSRSHIDINLENKKNTKIQFIKGDILNVEDVRNLFESIYKNNKKIIGIIHTAGSLLDQSFLKMDEYSLRKVIEPKLQGCLNIEKFWKLDDLKFFITYTSIGIYYSSAMQSNYTAANSAVNSWVIKKIGEGVPAKSIALGPVKAGMADELDSIHVQRLHRLGIDFIPVEKIKELLTISIRNKFPIVGYAIKSEKFSNKEKNAINLENISEAEVTAKLLSYISTLLSIKHTELDPELSLMDLGADSLLAVEISSWIQSNFLLSISMEKLLGSNNLKSIGYEIHSKIHKPMEVKKNQWLVGEV